jgi:hypothetical protein
MRTRARLLWLPLALVAVGACSSSSPTTPSVTAPLPLLPANNSQISSTSQPIALVVSNALSTGTSTLAYTFEVATDTAFANKVFSSSTVAQGANGQTTAQLGTLLAGTAYYWHARAGTNGVFSTTSMFSIGPAIVIGAPTPLSPLTGSTSNGWPTFTVQDAAHTGPVGPLVYRIDVSTSATFAAIVLTGTVPETPGQTNFTPPANTPAPAQTALFWRATAIDTVNLVSSQPSTVQSFTYSAAPSAAAMIAAQEGLALWPGVQPPGTNGHATLGNGWGVGTATSFNGVTFVTPPLEELQIFDLMDRGMDPQSAINWMNANGYPTGAAYYPAPGGNGSAPVIGFSYEYLGLINGAWNVIIKVGA